MSSSTSVHDQGPSTLKTILSMLRNDIRFRLLNLHIILALVVVFSALFFSGYARNQLEIELQRNDIALAQALALEVDKDGQSVGESSQNIVRWMEKVWGDQVAVVTVVDQNGQTVMQLRGGTTLLQNSDWEMWSSWQRRVIEFVLLEGAGSFFSVAPNGDRWVHSFVTTPDSDSRVIIQRPTNEAFAILRLIFRLMAAALVLYIIFIFIFWYRLSNTIISPLHTLEAFSSKITGHEITQVGEEEEPIKLAARTDQIGRLAQALSEMGKQYLITDDQLGKQTGRLEAILESMEAGLILENNSGEVLYCNRQASNWLNCLPTDVSGKHVLEKIPKLVGNQNQAKLVAFLKGNETEETIEISRSLKDGKIQDLNLHRFKVKDNRGNVIGTGQIWQDITNYREMDRMKSALISTVSHELRTPLTSIIGYSDSLLESEIEWNEEKRNRFTWRINSEARRLKIMIERLLDFTRLEGGRIEIMMRPCDLNHLVINVLDSMEIEKTVRFELDLHNELPRIKGDKERLETVIRNLLENALKYGDPKKNILVSTDLDDSHAIFTVYDTGTRLINVPAEKLFEPFYRLDTGYSRTSGGVGLGLAISRGFVQAHGGDVWFNSDASGTGFSFSIPIFDNELNKVDSKR